MISNKCFLNFIYIFQIENEKKTQDRTRDIYMQHYTTICEAIPPLQVWTWGLNLSPCVLLYVNSTGCATNWLLNQVFCKNISW